MNELINIDYKGEKPTISGRELHKALEVKTAYKDWFPRMCEYGFTEGTDFNSLIFEQVRLEGSRTVKREISDHKMTISMAKEICMLQRNEKGKQFRQYFIAVEEMWNSPEMVMKRALRLANEQIEELKLDNAVKQQQLAELQPKANYYDVVLNCKDLLPRSVIAKDYGWSAAKMNVYLNKKGIQYKQGNLWLLYQKYADKGYTHTKTYPYYAPDGTIHTNVHTYWTQAGRLHIYELLKADGIYPIIEIN
ncbi:MAG: phage antirepressor KilAC domain-containing protein [Firmicutes bacterium]|nr:phage antirepressor KilAC domain-containing protein [Bacillota bacterium]